MKNKNIYNLFIIILLKIIKTKKEINLDLYYNENLNKTYTKFYYYDNYFYNYINFNINFNNSLIIIYNNNKNKIENCQIKLNNYLISEIQSIYLNNNNNESNNIFELGLKKPNYFFEAKNNIIYKLEEIKYIDYKLFSISYNYYLNKIQLFLGTYPNISLLNNNLNHYIQCPIIDDNFICNFKEIKIYNLDKNLKNINIIIDLNVYYILISYQILLYLEENYFNKLIDNNSCNLGIFENKYTIICWNENFKELPSIYFYLDDKQYIIFNIENLFKKINNNKFIFLLVSENNKLFNLKNIIVLGLNFFKNFDFIFDYETNKIGLFNLNYINNENKNLTKFKYCSELNISYFNFYVKIIIFLSICIMILILLKKCLLKKKKLKKLYENEKELQEKFF